MKVKNFQQKDNLETPKQKNPFTCDLCDNHFSSKQMMNLHVKTLHEGKRQLVRCDLCDKYFSTKQVLQRHKQSFHEGRKDHKCSTCGREFSQSGTLNTHIKLVSITFLFSNYNSL